MYPAVPDNTDNTDQQAASTKSCFRVTAQVNQRTLNHKHERKRNGRKERLSEIKTVNKVLGSNSMDGALTIDNVFQTHTVHQNQRQTLTNFYYGNRMKMESKTNILFNNRIQDQMASAERRFVSGAGKSFFSEVDCLSKLQRKKWRWVSVKRNINNNGGE